MAFSFEDRARQKAEARARDEDRLARGEISAADLQKVVSRKWWKFAGGVISG
jgi:hypothetical protein